MSVRVLRWLAISALGVGLLFVAGFLGSRCERVEWDLVVCQWSPSIPVLFVGSLVVVGIGLLLAASDAAGSRARIVAVCVAALACGAILLGVSRMTTGVEDCTWAAYNLDGACDASALHDAIAGNARVGGIVLLAAGLVIGAAAFLLRGSPGRVATLLIARRV